MRSPPGSPGSAGSAVDPRDIELVRGLVAIPSLSRNEVAAATWLVARMAERGFKARIDEAGNAVGEIGGGPRHVVLLGHIDTVPGEIPVRVEGNDLVGRGAVDAKGPLAAFVAAASEPVSGVRVTVVGAVEEESPTSKGARHWATLPAPDWCVIGEPSGWDGVTVAYKGRLVLGVELIRSARHGAAQGATCAEEALALWVRIQAAAAPHARSTRSFDRLDCRLEGMRAGDLDARTRIAGASELEAAGREPLGERRSDGLVERSALRIGYRIPPGIGPTLIEAEVRALAAAHDGEAGVTVARLAAEEPARTPRTSSLARAFVRSVADAGGTVVFKEKSGTSDLNILAPAWGCPMVAYGPGDARYDHTPIERLDLADYARGIQVLRGVLRRAAAPPPTS